MKRVGHMNKKQKQNQKNFGENEKTPLFEKKWAKIVYMMLTIIFAATGLILMFLSSRYDSDILFYIALGVFGISTILLAQRSAFQQSKKQAGTNISSDEKEDEGLSLRHKN